MPAVAQHMEYQLAWLYTHCVHGVVKGGKAF